MIQQPPLLCLSQRNYQQRPESSEGGRRGKSWVCAARGRDSLVLFSQGKGREGSSPGVDKADKALWEWDALTEVRKGKGGRLGEVGSRISRCQCPEKTDTLAPCSLLYSVSSSHRIPKVSFMTTSSKLTLCLSAHSCTKHST